jgi:hypothetical protein
MSWTKLDDAVVDQLWSLSDAAHRLHLSGTIWSGRLLTDGAIPADRVRVLVPRFRPAALTELERCGLWTRTPEGWHIENFLVDQPSRREVTARRAYEAIRQAKSTAPTPEEKATWIDREEDAKRELREARAARRPSPHTVSPVVSPTVNDTVTHDAPSRPVPLTLTSFGERIPADQQATTSPASPPADTATPFDGFDHLERTRAGWIGSNARADFDRDDAAYAAEVDRRDGRPQRADICQICGRPGTDSNPLRDGIHRPKKCPGNSPKSHAAASTDPVAAEAAACPPDHSADLRAKVDAERKPGREARREGRANGAVTLAIQATPDSIPLSIHAAAAAV